MARQPVPMAPTVDELREELQRAEIALELASTQSALDVFRSMQRMQESTPWRPEVVDNDPGAWILTSSGGSIVDYKTSGYVFGRIFDPRILRSQSYRAWRTNPHARGLLRSLVKFIIGRNFKYDYQDQARGQWADALKKDKLKKSADDSDDPLLVALLFEAFSRENNWLQRAKEIVLRTFRDGECFIRRFVSNGRVMLRFIEPDHVQSHLDNKDSQAVVVNPDGTETVEPTMIRFGIEFLARDIETVVAYHVRVNPSAEAERVDAADVIHVKCNADHNDLRGFPFLEVIMKRLTQYEQWEEYRILLNKVRTAIALVRKIEGTPQQAAGIVAQRQPARANATGAEPVTASGNREAMFKGGTVLTPGPGVSYEFTNARMNAQDAQHDGRRILLSIAAGAGLPEMFVTGDFSNANFASTTEAVKIAMREWEDWQDFFEPVFVRIYEWVLDAGIESRGLPADTDRAVIIQWPSIIVEDPEKSTSRRAILFQNGILSRTTWAAQEGLVYDDELENMSEEAEELGARPGPGLPDPELDDPDDPRPDDRAEAIHQVNDALLQLESLQEAFAKGSPEELKEAAEAYVESARALLMRRIVV